MEQDIVVSQGKLMRRGYTTGSCAAAASKAAAVMLLSGEETDTIKLDTPKGITLTLDVLDILRGPGLPAARSVRTAATTRTIRTGR